MNIFVSGSVAYDIILDYPGRFADHINPGKVHALSLSFLVRDVKKSIGGTAGNIAYYLAMLNLLPHVVASIGPDADEILSKFTQLRVKTEYLQFSKLPTAAAYIMTDRNDNQIAGFHPGAMMETCKLPKVKSGDWAIIAAENPANMARLAAHYQKNKMRYIFDPGQAITALSKRQLEICVRGAAIVIGNDYEIEYVFRSNTPRPPLNLRGGEGGVIVRTIGPRGSEIIYPNGQKITIGVAKVKKAVDPTGAGDAYRAGLLYGIIRGHDLKTSCELGATAASFAVEKYGTQNHRFDYGILVKRYNKNFKDKI